DASHTIAVTVILGSGLSSLRGNGSLDAGAGPHSRSPAHAGGGLLTLAARFTRCQLHPPMAFVRFPACGPPFMRAPSYRRAGSRRGAHGSSGWARPQELSVP